MRIDSCANRTIILFAAIAISTITEPVFAESATDNGDQTTGLTEIIVTATRQAVSSQSVPLSLTAIGAAELQEQGIISVDQLNQVAPSLYIQEGIGIGSPRFSIRGLSTTDVGPNGSSPVTLYVDDVAQSNSYANSMGLFDTQRVEVLRGPQGTLFGKNTTGGAINYFSQTPTQEAEGYLTVHLAGGDQATQFLEGAINLPIIDNVLAMRLSFHADHEGD
jgi:iron complex outermembrane receptor protein